MRKECSMQSNRSVQSPPTALLSQWQSLTPLPTARNGPAAVLGPDGRIYALGGVNSSGNLTTVEAYDPRTKSWTAVASLPTARYNLAAALGPDGRIYAIGGTTKTNGSLPTVEAYDPRTNTWTAVASLPTARAGLA